LDRANGAAHGVEVVVNRCDGIKRFNRWRSKF